MPSTSTANSRLVRVVVVSLCWAVVVLVVQRKTVIMEALAWSLDVVSQSANVGPVVAISAAASSARASDAGSAEAPSVNVLLALDESALESFVAGRDQNEDKLIRVDLAALWPADNTVLRSLAQDTVRAVQRPVYAISDPALDGDLRLQASRELAKVAAVVHRAHVERSAMRVPTIVLDDPSLTLLVPFLRQALRDALGERTSFEIGVVADEGMNTAFRASLTHALEFAFPHLVDEDRIDRICLDRKQQSTRWARPACNFTNWVNDRISWPAGHSCLPCTILETRVLQRASLWAVLVPALARERRVRIVRTHVRSPGLDDEDGQTPKNRRPLVGNVEFGLESLFVATVPSAGNEGADPPLWKRSRIAHKRLVEELADVVGAAQTAVGFASPDPEDARLCPLIEHFIDAGSCWPKTENAARRGPMDRTKRVNVAVVACLPRLIVAGVQKAGTGEMGIWLDENPNFRRQDGGMETHFFDCTGRGAGKDRPSCHHFRDKRMKEIGQAVRDDHAKGAVANTFAWSETSGESRSWYLYATLGHLNFAQMLERRLIFDKSPAYFDLANPMDVMRILPSVKLVFLLRDPVERFHSSYFQTCVRNLAASKARCTETRLKRKLDRVLETEILAARGLHQDVVDDAGELIRALKVGHYADNLARWVDAFPSDQLLVLFMEDFRAFPTATLRTVEDFMSSQISQGRPPSEMERPLRSFKYTPIRVDDRYWVVNNRSKAFRPSHNTAMLAETTVKLRAYYRPRNERLLELFKTSSLMLQGPGPSLVPSRQVAKSDLPAWLGGLR